MPALFLVGALFLLGNYLVSESRAFALDVVLIVSGVPAYWLCAPVAGARRPFTCLGVR